MAINLSNQQEYDKAINKGIQFRAKMFIEVAIDNALAAYGGDGKQVEKIVLEMLEQMKHP